MTPIYGQGVWPQSPSEAGAQAGKYRNDPALLRARIRTGLDVLAGRELTDHRRIAAVGEQQRVSPLLPQHRQLLRGHRQGEVGALHMPDVALGLLVAALDPAHPRDHFLEGVELVRGLAGVGVTGRPLP